ncbi:ATP-binding cassette domain-containing protein [Sulfolobus acidocaldarius]|uniref:ABC-type transport system n=4 Tax=Sulfolobus acidocaldarius TaxID=2285 RepID=Q4JAD5_SULAC|nr:ATP-binding cassette domain-containing protein [Sulfolobus acidocaldarius]AAY80245.1 ABC-type transport system [Sulfolobus acidocaldarius DSM 639]AGE70825.1 ABC-type transport system [Sulfolobus acidocaldarius N8]AGE73096.1 ABC-type transport system [Sulfolobus acidocaldarius Ron12/I]ALU28859.1 ABC transporter ATP-binding protein [Sulfolobus acidocaldarius]ALU31581.1 ABC transporter ATP-binding protein [Sulfolobus acidocaldarius]
MLSINDTLVIDDNDIVGLVGKNGSGKTTLIKNALCLGQNRFKIILDGDDFCEHREYSKLTGVFQEPATQILALTCEEELKLRSLFHTIDFNIAKKIMENYINRDFYTLSDGYKKRFVIASALSSNPKHILLDEPFANLDKYSTKLVKEIIPKGSLIAEHRIKEIRDLVSKVYLIKEINRIVEIEKEKLYDEKFLREEGLRGFKLPEINIKPKDKVIFEYSWIKLREGEILCLVGRNGVGKTTTLKKLVNKVYIIFQNPDLQFFKPRVIDEVKDEEALRLFKIKDLAEKSPFTLSYGQKMRVLIATAFASGSKVIGFDEPSVGMDGEALLSFYQMVKILKEEGKAMIIATHDEDILSLCDKVVNLEEMRIVYT